jgi:UDP-hydrolysing UDP-N-acetyl-D-glucosamine 2-epimerase
MGEDPSTVFETGCPSIDLAARALENPHLDFDPYQRYGGVGASADLSQGYLVAMQHPVTTEYEEARSQVTETLHATKEVSLPTLWFWPNVDAGADGTSKGIRSFREREAPESMHFFKHMEPLDFLRLVLNSEAIVGNSSVGIRECSFLGVPAVNVGNRQSGRERGANVIDVGHDRRQIAQAIRACVETGRSPRSNLYGDGHAGERIADLLASVSLRTRKGRRIEEHRRR